MPGSPGVLLVLLALSWVLAIAEHASFLFVATAAIFTVVAVWQLVDVLKNGGVHKTPDGITNRRAFGYRQWRWEAIEEFTNVRSRLYLVTRDRRSWPLLGVAESTCPQ